MKKKILIPDRLKEDTEIEDNIFGEGYQVITQNKKDASQITDEIWQSADAILAWHEIDYDAGLISKLQNIQLANKVRKTLSKRYLNRKGGYTRIIKAGYRYGDKAPMAVIEFIDRDLEAKKVDKKKKNIIKDSKEEEKLATA